jgi:hypothetical protein
MPNTYVFPEGHGPLQPHWTDPLLRIATAVGGDGGVPSDAFFDPQDFRIMAKLVRTSSPDIVLYRHSFTRRYINVDAGGRTYRYVEPRSGDLDRPGRYYSEPFRKAVQQLGLWELAWMKPELLPYTRGLLWDDRRLMFDYRTRDLIPLDQPMWCCAERYRLANGGRFDDEDYYDVDGEDQANFNDDGNFADGDDLSRMT